MMDTSICVRGHIVKHGKGGRGRADDRRQRGPQTVAAWTQNSSSMDPKQYDDDDVVFIIRSKPRGLRVRSRIRMKYKYQIQCNETSRADVSHHESRISGSLAYVVSNVFPRKNNTLSWQMHAPQGEADEEDNVYVCSWMYTISKNGLKTAQETPETPPQLPQDT